MKPKKGVSISKLKDWWWLGAILVGAIVVWGNLPQRVTSAEQDIDDLKGWAKEMQGYTRAIQQTQQVLPTRPTKPMKTLELPEIISEWEDGVEWCCNYTKYKCESNYSWYICDNETHR